jgi:hypothetical protein
MGRLSPFSHPEPSLKKNANLPRAMQVSVRWRQVNTPTALAGIYGILQVEMAGIEPASRELDHRCTTSLVGLLFLTRFTLDRRSVKQARRSGTEAPALALLIAVGSAALRFL